MNKFAAHVIMATSGVAFIALSALLTACSLFSSPPQLPTRQEVSVLQCKAEALAPFIHDQSEKLKLAKRLIKMEDTGDLSVEDVLSDIGLEMIQIDLFKQAYRACEKQ